MPVLPPKPVRELCKVLYPYEPANGDELELVVGDVITVISKPAVLFPVCALTAST